MTIKIGFVGGSGHHYLQRLVAQGAGGSYLHAFAPDPHDPEMSARMHERLGHPPQFDSLDAMLTEFRPDVLSVGMVYARNIDGVLPALRHDIPVVCDKPVAASRADLARLRDAIGLQTALVAEGPSEESEPGPRLITEFDFRSRPEVVAARDCIRGGHIGQPILAVIQKSYRWGVRPQWYRDRDLYGGTVLWIASHGIDAVRFLTGQELVSSVGTGGNLGRPERAPAEDHTVNLLEFDGGMRAVVHADLLRPQAAATHGDDRIRVVGSTGQVEVIDGGCWWTANECERTRLEPESTPAPLAEALLSAALYDEHPDYNTAETLATADAILLCQQAVDDGQRLEAVKP